MASSYEDYEVLQDEETGLYYLEITHLDSGNWEHFMNFPEGDDPAGYATVEELMHEWERYSYWQENLGWDGNWDLTPDELWRRDH